MYQKHELAGTIVLVHPELRNDPANKKNQVGRIISADLSGDNITVRFSDDSDGLFSADALMVLRDTKDIRRAADIDFTLMPREDYYDIMDVCFFAGSQSPYEHRVAVELVQKSTIAWEYAMQPLDEALGLHRQKNIGR